MNRIKFLMVGGFLGAGKTTTIAKLAEHYTNQGLKVGIVTNDQAYDLVDTNTLRSKGFDVGEVPGACFCCKFEDLISTISDLADSSVPDLVIAEPVGSCTDLFATVVLPMKQLFGDRFELGPLVVLLKPEHGEKILGEKSRRGFSPDAEYIFLKQLEEADVIAINKIDKLDDERLNSLSQSVQNRFPSVPCLRISAREERNLESLYAILQRDPQPRATIDVDYARYAVGEAELGWLNCQLQIESRQKFPLDDVVFNLTQRIGGILRAQEFEIAHLKILGQTEHSAAVANLVSSDSKAELGLRSDVAVDSAILLVNARVAGDPEKLVDAVQTASNEYFESQEISFALGNVQSFRPAEPKPTHRISVGND